MGDLFYNLGRKLGHAAIPAAQKTRWTWRLFTGSEEESIQAETEMGAAMARTITLAAPDAGVSADTELLRQICGNLAQPLKNKTRSFTLNLVHHGAPTAFTLPGGFIFVDASVPSAFGRREDELAFLLGHEIGHAVRRHSLNRWVAGLGINVISTLISRGGVGPWWQQHGQEVLRNAYTHEQEWEADEFGFRLARAAGYDPEAAFRALELLQALRQTPGGLGEEFAAHPPESARGARLRKVRQKLIGGAPGGG